MIYSVRREGVSQKFGIQYSLNSPEEAAMKYAALITADELPINLHVTDELGNENIVAMSLSVAAFPVPW